MPASMLEARVRRQSPCVAVIELHGEVNAVAEEVLTAAYAEAKHGEPAIVLLKFADVDYSNSTGIALIVSLLVRARKAHRRLLACGLSQRYVELFTITRLADFMRMVPDEAAASAAASASATE
jgi:anti-sigma B factor antagonist